MMRAKLRVKRKGSVSFFPQTIPNFPYSPQFAGSLMKSGREAGSHLKHTITIFFSFLLLNWWLKRKVAHSF